MRIVPCMSFFKLIGATCAVLLIVGYAGSVPAHAETRVKSDRLADAPDVIDISGVSYTHGNERVRVTAQIPHLGSAGEAALSISKFEIFEAGYVVRIVKQHGKPAKVGLFFFNHFDLEKRVCNDVSGSWDAERYSLEGCPRVPRWACQASGVRAVRHRPRGEGRSSSRRPKTEARLGALATGSRLGTFVA